MWSSRKALIANAIGLVVLIYLIGLDQNGNLITEELSPPDASNSLGQSFMETVRRAASAIEYLYAMQKGTADVASVVESGKEVIEVRGCSFLERAAKPVFPSSSQNGWLSNEGFHMFSAFLDHRNNSLFPSTSSIQVAAFLITFLILLVVQVLASVFGELVDDKRILCHLYSQPQFGSRKSVVKAHVRMVWQKAWGNYLTTEHLQL